MTREILLGTAAALLIAVPASALTMTVIKDGRSVEVFAAAGNDSDSNDDFADASTFTGEVTAHAMESEIPIFKFGDADTTHGYGAWADANARQHSEIGALSISGEGSANASGSHGNLNTSVSALGGGGLGFGEFQANASSTIIILFNIDEAAEYNLSGFISAGIEQAVGEFDNAVESFASVFLIDDDEEEIIFEREVFEDGLKFDETGVIGPGNYAFSIRARANVFGGGFADEFLGDNEDTQHPDFGYAAGSRFGGNLELRPLDKPIPEPVTASLAFFGLGALGLQASRRRRA